MKNLNQATAIALLLHIRSRLSRNVVGGLLLATGSLLLPSTAGAQDIHFSQFFEAPLYRNPALAGIVYGDYRVQTVYRSQWNNITDAYKTTSLNVEYKLPVRGADYLTLAMQLFHDRAGTTNLSTTQVLPAVNYHKSLSDVKSTYLSLGFMGGYVQRSIDRSKMTTNTTYTNGVDGEDGLLPTYNYWDGSAGISFNTQLGQNPENNLVVGAALHHFLRPKNSFFDNAAISIQPKLVLSADVKLAIGDRGNMTVYNDYVNQGSYHEQLLGALYTHKLGAYIDNPDYSVGLGGFLRWGDALIPTAQLTYRPFTLSMSYDVNVSRLSTTSYGQGGYEMSVTYKGFLDRENSAANAVLCPRF